jgi:membrane protease YdiL (CAAX protease family)
MEQKTMSKFGKFWWVFYPLLLFIGIQVVAAVLCSVVMVVVMLTDTMQNPGTLPDVAMDSPLVNATNFAAFALSGVVSLFLGIILMKRDSKKHGLVRDKSQNGSLLSWIAVILAAVGFCFFGNFLLTMTNLLELFPFSKAINDMMESIPTPIMFFAAVIIAPFTEELFCRGMVFKRLRSMMGFLPSALISGFLFGLLHMNVVQGLYAILGGVIFAYIYEKKQSLSGTIVAHMAANACSFFIESLPEFFSTSTGMLVTTVVSGIVCIVSILLIKASFKNSPAWQVKAI